MSKPTQEQKLMPSDKQIREFWERCGLIWGRGGGWFDKRQFIGDILPPNLTNLFKYAFPKFMIDYHDWRSVLHDWVDQLTGDTEKDTILLFNILCEHFNIGQSGR